jgi:2-(1,2-epoxy-1,2-dihydrophenyl)acetyl-CoA isomerase
MAFETIRFEIKSGIATLTLNRPDKLNCFDDRMHAEIRDALKALKADSSARVLVLTGAGRAFSSGQDLAIHQATMAAGGTVDPTDSLDRDFNRLARTIVGMDLPVIAAINGVAAGAAVNVALSCDFVIAARSAQFIQAFTRIGLVPDCGGSYFLPRLIGDARARGLLMLAEPLSAERAAEWGMIWKCVDDGMFSEEVSKLAEFLASRATRALAMTKRALAASSRNTLAAQLDLERDLQVVACGTDDFREGVAAFVEKRPAVFRGQ